MDFRMVAFGVTLLVPALMHTAGTALAADPQCHANEGFLVAVQEYDEEAGSRFAITALGDMPAPEDCVFDLENADRVIGESGDPLWFGELTSDFLIATRSTGPEGDLVVFELSNGNTVLDVPANDYAVEDGFLSFWQRNGEATEENCPDLTEHRKNGLGSIVSEHMVFDLDLKTVEKTGDTRCDATQ